ncbi:hypothetical protein [Paenibacillus sp. LK1]|uniref:hypothetical protein n=1 Tax=Paenibacillus sp. LK1 TaxID=2053014 RepID=UPI000C18B517|nr:hypothetical protein [Paenibacillus sp. LK1]PIH59094.1 hypothetical protein CS562_14230 [Paenibacillus sp. LK1]
MSSLSRVNNKRVPKEKDQTNKAVVSFIFSLLGVITLIWVLYGTAKADEFMFRPFLITLFFNLGAMILGWKSRNSLELKGLAVAAITISAIPLALIAFVVISTLPALIRML